MAKLTCNSGLAELLATEKWPRNLSEMYLFMGIGTYRNLLI